MSDRGRGDGASGAEDDLGTEDDCGDEGSETGLGDVGGEEPGESSLRQSRGGVKEGADLVPKYHLRIMGEIVIDLGGRSCTLGRLRLVGDEITG